MEREIGTEDAATILLRFENGARGAGQHFPDQPRPEELAPCEVDGSQGAIAWRLEQPDQIWFGHRERQRDPAEEPALMGRLGQGAAALPAATWRAFADTFAALFRAIYADVATGRGCQTDSIRLRPATTSARQRRSRRERPSGDGSPWPGNLAPAAASAGAEARPLTAPFPGDPLADVVDWTPRTASRASRSPAGRARPDRAGGIRDTSHIDVANLSAARPTELVDQINAKGCRSPAWAITPTPFTRSEHREMVIGHLRH